VGEVNGVGDVGVVADGDQVGYSPEWLDLREGADADARSADLPTGALADLPGGPRLVVHDLGCGTGSMTRWLARRLPGPQHWVLHDRDPHLLRQAAARAGATAEGAPVTVEGAPVTVETRQGDVTALTAGDLAGASLVTASALLDLLTGEEVDRLAAAVVGAGCPALITLSVLGRVELDPTDPLDAGIAAAFNAHQRRSTGGRRLLGPDAVDATTGAFTRLGATVRVRPSPWRLGPARVALIAEWLRGWVGAAAAHRPQPWLGEYLDRRLEAAAAGELRVVVHHADLLVRPNARYASALRQVRTDQVPPAV
jgi:hypothetical protein